MGFFKTKEDKNKIIIVTMPNKNKGQAITEFAVLSIIVILAWILCLHYALKIYAKTSAQATALACARKSLSKQNVKSSKEISVKTVKLGPYHIGKAKVLNEQKHYIIRDPSH